MKRLLLVLAAIAPLGTGACNKPTPEECRQAISHMEQLLGTETTERNTDIEGEVRRCRGGSTKEAVACAIKAQTKEDLKACAFNAKGKKTDQDTAAPPPTPSTTSPSTPGAPAPSAPAPSAPPSAPSTTAPAPGAPPSPPPPSTK